MNRKILITESPIVECYSKLGAIFSILQPYEENLSWLFYNFTHLVYFFDEILGLSWIDLCNAVFPIHAHEWETCPYLENCIYLYNDSLYKNIVNIILSSIDEKQFVYITLNRKYLKCLNEFTDFIHDTLIIGYDLGKKMFLCKDFYYGKYSELWFPFDEVSEAFENIKINSQVDPLGKVYTLKYQKPVLFPYTGTVNINRELAINNIKSLTKVIPIPGSEVLIANGTDCSSDLLVYDKLAYNILYSRCDLTDIRPFYAIRCHVRLLNIQSVYWNFGNKEKLERMISSVQGLCYQSLKIYMCTNRKKNKEVDRINFVKHLNAIKKLEQDFIDSI